MDWYLDPSDADAPRRLRYELEDYLRRHGTSDESDIWGGITGGWELISNAVRHAPGAVWVSVEWSDGQALIEVHDLGAGFVLEEGLAKIPGVEGGLGLKLASSLGNELRAREKTGGGVRVSLRLPVFRERGEDQVYSGDMPAHGIPLSNLSSDTGFMDRETFLLGLAVNLVRNIDLGAGPGVARQLVNQVGRQIGAEMEAAYRSANDIEGPLTAPQMADLFVGLKAAIDGDFRVVEASDDRIVLANERCPFGSVVQQAPSLCQMTSAVFGGIAANNRTAGRVQLDERIAVGDAACRIVVELNSAETEMTSEHQRSEIPRTI